MRKNKIIVFLLVFAVGFSFMSCDDGGTTTIVGGWGTEEVTTQILVVGAGSAGLYAANVALRESGRQVLLIEANHDELQNQTAVSGGGFFRGADNIVGNWTYDEEILWLNTNGRINDMRLVRLWVRNNRPTMHFMHSIGVLGPPSPLGAQGTGNRAGDFAHTGGAPGITANALREYRAAGGQILFNTRAIRLLTNATGAVNGVLAETPNGFKRILAEDVILATGGFGNNRSLLSEELLTVLYYGHDDAGLGDGLLMAVAPHIRAMTWFMEHGKIYPHGIYIGNGRAAVGTGAALFQVASGNISAVYVNRAGQRAVDETLPFVRQRDATRIAEGGSLFLLMDSVAFPTYRGSFGHFLSTDVIDAAVTANGAQGHPMFASGSIAEIAAIAGVDPVELEATRLRFNSFVESGIDGDYGREMITDQPIATPPFFLVEQNMRFATTLGGLNVDNWMRVIREDGSYIPGLFAAGEIIGGAHGQDSQPSRAIAWAMTSGYLAGRSVSGQRTWEWEANPQIINNTGRPTLPPVEPIDPIIP